MAETPETPVNTGPPPEPWQPKFNPWLIAVVVAMAAFMEVLDTSIANVALPYIAGGLAASNSQSTWVLTSYLAANAVVLPISGWLAGRFGRKRFFILCILLFTVSSVLCGSAPNLAVLILFRALQGAGGGGLQPMAQAILADTFPPQKRGMAFALYGITAVLAPTIGPTLGGWITFNYTWRWIFYINLPIGILAAFLVFRMVEDPPYLSLRKRAGIRLDYIGLGFLAVGIGALQVVLDKGQEDDWFGSRFILTLSVIAAICLISLVIWEWLHRDPIMDLRLFKNFNFATANLMMFILGVVYFSSLVLMPQFLQTLMGYTAESAGLVLSASGVVLLVAMPIVGQLSARVPAKYLIAFGWLSIGSAMLYSTKRIDLDISFRVAMWLRVAQTAGLPFLFVPITLASYIGIPAGKEQRCRGTDQFHAQYWQQRGNLNGDDIAGSPRTVPSIDAGLPRHWLRSRVSDSSGRTDAAATLFRRHRRRCARQGIWPHLPGARCTGPDAGVSGCVHGAGGWSGDHVPAVVFGPQERSDGRRRSGGGMIGRPAFRIAPSGELA